MRSRGVRRRRFWWNLALDVGFRIRVVEFCPGWIKKTSVIVGNIAGMSQRLLYFYHFIQDLVCEERVTITAGIYL
jgi:hypothetical protein